MWTASSRFALKQEASVGVNAHLHFGKWATREKMLWVGPKRQRRGPRARPSEALMHMVTQTGLWILNHH